MANEIERDVARRLQEIAEQIRIWERRDFEDQIASGSKKLTRTTYDFDLDDMAAMLEGRHREIRLKAERAGRGRPTNVGNLDRDVAIVKHIDRHRLDPKSTIAKGILTAVNEFGVSESTARKAWADLRFALDPVNEPILLFFERLRRRGMVKMNQTTNPPEK